MTDEEKIIQLYKDMYSAMVNKDKSELESVHDDSFVLIHMTGIGDFECDISVLPEKSGGRIQILCEAE